MRLQLYTGVKTGTQKIIRIERKEQEKKKKQKNRKASCFPTVESEKEEAAYMLRHKTWVFGNIKQDLIFILSLQENFF